ncbi:Non-catalytic module family DOC2, partial [Piromyces sp. E2]
ARDDGLLEENIFDIKTYTEEISVENNTLIETKQEFIEYRGKSSSEEVTLFKFFVTNLSEINKNPILQFKMLSYKDDIPRKTVSVIMKLRPKKILPSVEYNIGYDSTVIPVEPNSQLILVFGADSSSQEQWILTNVAEIAKTGLVNFVSINYRSDCDVINIEPKQIGCGEKSAFNFEIKNVTNKEKLPVLKFVARSPSGETMSNVNVTLNLTKEAPEVPEIPLKEYFYQVNEDTEIAVSSHSLITIELELDPSVPYEWLISNANGITNSGIVEIINNRSNFCGDKENCSDTAQFIFQVNEIEKEDELPKIKFSFEDMSSSKPDSSVRKITVTLKREGEEPTEEVCTFKDYPCCTKTSPKVYYHDKDGDWSVEKGDWCFIKKEEAPTTSNCQPKDGYPVCETTKEVVYTDSDKWGVEHHQWCIICN